MGHELHLLYAPVNRHLKLIAIFWIDWSNHLVFYQFIIHTINRMPNVVKQQLYLQKIFTLNTKCLLRIKMAGVQPDTLQVNL